jgi:hypothetical protein
VPRVLCQHIELAKRHAMAGSATTREQKDSKRRVVSEVR